MALHLSLQSQCLLCSLCFVGFEGFTAGWVVTGAGSELWTWVMSEGSPMDGDG